MTQRKDKFATGDVVIHQKTSTAYLVLGTPSLGMKLEADAAPAYGYVAVEQVQNCVSPEEGPYDVWVRRASEFEDGRFVLSQDSELARRSREHGFQQTLAKIRFENWAKKHHLPLDRTVSDTRYCSMETEWAWRALCELAEWDQ